MGVGHWTKVPTVGSVQGYFAREKAAQYYVPPSVLTAIERWGTRSHRDLIAVSPEIAAKLRLAAPDANVHTIGNGIDEAGLAEALRVPVETEPGLVVFIGRLEIDQKGLDLLLDALERVPAARVLVAGDGKHADRFAAMVRSRGLSERVQLLGRVDGAEKWRLLARVRWPSCPRAMRPSGSRRLRPWPAARPCSPSTSTGCARRSATARRPWSSRSTLPPTGPRCSDSSTIRSVAR